MKKNILFLVFVTGMDILCAQQDNTSSPERTPTIIGLNIDYGYILKHYENLRELEDAYPKGIGLE